MAGLQYVTEPDYSALLLRRTFADLSLPHALMDRADEWLQPTDACWKDKNKTWEFPNGATLTFGYLENEKDKYRYQGAEFQYIGCDEATQFTETQYTYLFSRLRRLEGSDIPIRFRAASNPGGVGHEWVKNRFITYKDEQGNIINPQEDLSKRGRFFVPAKIEDNPYLDKDAYIESLEELDPVTQAQLRDGNWDIQAKGEMFKREWFDFVDAAPPGCKKVRFWDMASTEPHAKNKDPDWTSGLLMGERNGEYYVIDIFRCKLNTGDRDLAVEATVEMDPLDVIQRGEQEPGSSGKDVIFYFAKTVFKGRNFIGVPSTGSKVVRAGPVSAACKNGLIHIVKGPWNTPFIQQLELFPQEGVHDDMVDTFSGAYLQLVKAPKKQKPTRFGSGSGVSSSGARV
jgi:predicted phage terminase large subunit-like protein